MFLNCVKFRKKQDSGRFDSTTSFVLHTSLATSADETTIQGTDLKPQQYHHFATNDTVTHVSSKTHQESGYGSTWIFSSTRTNRMFHTLREVSWSEKATIYEPSTPISLESELKASRLQTPVISFSMSSFQASCSSFVT